MKKNARFIVGGVALTEFLAMLLIPLISDVYRGYYNMYSSFTGSGSSLCSWMSTANACASDEETIMITLIVYACFILLLLGGIFALAFQSKKKVGPILALVGSSLYLILSVAALGLILSELGGDVVGAGVYIGMLLASAGIVFSILGLVYSKGEKRPIPGSTAGRLRCVAGMYNGGVFPMDDKPLVLGRDSACCQLIFDASCQDVSRRHCVVVYHKSTGNYDVTDYSSTGTYINGRPLTPGVTTSLGRGSEIQLGASKGQAFRLE